jgi:formylglycine-generating enzyme required for sulfatase activity
MSNPDFDPYHEWLGIPPDEQPANHYRLLGLELFEADRDMIESVSLKHIAHVRTFAIGANSERSQLLLNELSAARLTLLNAVQKADYDQELRQRLNIAPPPVEVISESTQQAVTSPPQEYEAPPEAPNFRPDDPATSDAVSRQSLYISVGAGIGLTIVVLVCVMLYLRSQKLNEAVYQALNQGDYEGALELDPGNEQARAMQRTADLVRFALDRRDYREVLRLDPTNAQGIELKNAADLRQALAAGDYARALLLDPGNPEVIKLRSSELRQALGDGDYARALEIDPTSPEALAMKDAAELRQALADGDYSRALEIDPNNSEALAMKDAAELRQALADGDYARALEIDPGNAEALVMKRANTSRLPAIAPFDAAQAKDYQEAWAKYLGVEVETENSIGMKLRVIPPGTFMMGENYNAHEVTLTKPFMLGTYEVTQAQYEQVMGVNPSSVKGAKNPVEMVSWNDTVEFCRKLSELPAEKAVGNVYRLPTEAEWEFACRAGTTTKYSFGDDESESGDYAWYRENSGKTPHPVGGKQPNAWGLYDIHGNVWEWCQDWRGAYPDRAVTDPTGAVTGSSRVDRGGSWNFNAEDCRSAFRSRFNPSGRYYGLGFRVVRSSGKQLDANTELAEMAPKDDDTNSPPTAPSTAPPPANAPFNVSKAKEHQEAWAKYLGVEVETDNSIGMKLSVIPAGTFIMGEGGDAHEVTLTKPFMLGTYEVTQGQYQRVMGTNPSKFKGVNNPVETLSWDEAVEFCRRLSELPAEKAAGNIYRLPTEAEWEFACRAGTTTRYSFGDNESELGQHAWWNGNSGKRTHPVGIKLPNALGLFDLHGNVREWCQDRYESYPRGAVTDPTGAASGSDRVNRGGSWYDTAGLCRSAFRYRLYPSGRNRHYGFRVCLSPSGQ